MLSALQPSNAAKQLPISPALALAKAGGNHAQIEAALKAVPTAQKEGMEFLVANMPDSDLQSLTSKFLLQYVVKAVSHGLAVEGDDFALGVGMQTVREV